MAFTETFTATIKSCAAGSGSEAPAVVEIESASPAGKGFDVDVRAVRLAAVCIPNLHVGDTVTVSITKN